MNIDNRVPDAQTLKFMLYCEMHVAEKEINTTATGITATCVIYVDCDPGALKKKKSGVERRQKCLPHKSSMIEKKGSET